MSRNRLVNIIVPYGTKVSDVRQQVCQIDVGPFHRCKLVFTTFTARNAVNDVGGGAYKIVPTDNETGFRSGNRCMWQS